MRLFALSIAVFSLFAATDVVLAQSPTLGNALSIVSKARRQPVPKTKAFFQRNRPGEDFFRIIQRRKRDLQIAFVVDGTESMDADIRSAIESIQSVVTEIQAEEGGKLELALVVYRDTFSRDPAATEDLTEAISPIEGIKFTTDLALFTDTLRSVKTKTGQPYFEELVDSGIAAALSLDWAPADQPDVTRWVIVSGDAPPFYVGNGQSALEQELREHHQTAKEKWNSGRQFSNDQLVQAAKEKGVNVLSILCSARSNLPDSERFNRTFKRLKPYATEFFRDVSERTGGSLLDLSDPETIQYLAQRGRAARFEQKTQELALISESELNRRRGQRGNAGRPVGPKDLTFAVLPHVAFQDLNKDGAWDHEVDSDQNLTAGLEIALELRERFERTENLRVKSFKDTEDACRGSYRRSQAPEELMADVAAILGVDYVVWGVYAQVGSQAQLSSGLYAKLSGDLLASGQESLTVGEGQDQARLNLSTTVVNKLLENAYQVLQQNNGSSREELVTFASAAGIKERIDRQQPLSDNLDAQRYILFGLKSLEESLRYFHNEEGYSPGEVRRLLESAITDFKTAIRYDQQNPTPHLFLGSAYYNLAIAGDSDDAMPQFFKSLQNAKNFSKNAPTDEIMLEIEADYALVVSKDIADSIRLYQALAQGTDGRANSALRAHWMLAGIYSGDWGVDRFSRGTVNLAKAREHILEILAHWSESPEARFYYDKLVSSQMQGVAANSRAAVPLVGNVLLQEAGL